MDLVGINLADLSMVERLLLAFNMRYAATPTGNECFEWVSQPCTSYDYLGGDLAYGPASSHAGALRVEVVSEPATGMLLATGLAGLAALRQRRKPR